MLGARSHPNPLRFPGRLQFGPGPVVGRRPSCTVLGIGRTSSVPGRAPSFLTEVGFGELPAALIFLLAALNLIDANLRLAFSNMDAFSNIDLPGVNFCGAKSSDPQVTTTEPPEMRSKRHSPCTGGVQESQVEYSGR